MIPLAPGTLFAGDYRILRPLSAGGMGAVYVAEQVSTRKLRAVKLMHGQLLADEGSRRRFEQEARIAAKIPSDHVVEVQAAGVDYQTGLPFLVMELLEGETLEAMVRRRGALPPGEVRVVMEQVCHAVGAAHQAGIVHRDLKPLNVFMARARRTDAAFTVKVLDFGIAKLLHERSTQTASLGSPLWLAPEQTERGQVAPATDAWALGLLAYFLLTGRCFWRSATAEEGSLVHVMREVLFDPIPAASTRAAEQGCGLPAGFDAWFAGCVHRDPSRRFPDASRAFAALAPLLPSGGQLIRDAGAPLGAAAEVRAAYESGQLSSFQPAAGGIATASSAAEPWMGRQSSAPLTTTRRGGLAAAARGGMFAGCLALGVLVPLLGAGVIGGGYLLLQARGRDPTTAKSGSVSGPLGHDSAHEATRRTDAELPDAEVDPSPDRRAASAPAAAAPDGRNPLRPTQGSGTTATADPARPTDRGNSATTTLSTTAPTRELAWKIAHAVKATDLKPCLYSKITRPNNGTFAVRHTVTVRFDRASLLGVSAQGKSTYPASDLINRDTFDPATQAEVDAELRRVLSCIQRKAGGTRIPENGARGTVAVSFTGADLIDAAVR